MGCIHSAPKHNKHGGGRGGGGSFVGRGGRQGGAPKASDSEIRDRIECSPASVTTTVGTTVLRYAYLSQRGYYPDALDKANQDCFLVCRNFMRDPNRALFSVFDGHGREGDLCAQFARDLLVEKLGEHLRGKQTEKEIRQGITRGFLELNDMLHRNPAIDDTLSGTTAITVLFFRDTMYIANVGDSRAIVAQRLITEEKAAAEALTTATTTAGQGQAGQGQENGGGGGGVSDGGALGATAGNGGGGGGGATTSQNGGSGGDGGQVVQLRALPLSDDQTPYRKDERERVKRSGARVLSMDQISGVEPVHEDWGDVRLGEDIDEAGDPPRIWSKYGEYPGTAFTRSLGDSIAEELGVYAVPEITVRKVVAQDAFVVIASDGVFEFLTNQSVVDIIRQHPDPLQACHAVVQEAYDLWLKYEVRTDDITIICIFIDATGGVPTAFSSFTSSSSSSHPATSSTTPRSAAAAVAQRPHTPRSPRGGSLGISSLDVSATVATPTSVSRALEAAQGAQGARGGGGEGGV